MKLRSISAAVLTAAFGGGALGQPAPSPGDSGTALGSEGDLVEAMTELESQLNGVVVSSTKTAQRAAESPAVITVVSAEEIQARGYTNLADVLRSVPGFYDVYDLVTHNVGVRGINGGARASGNVLKVMIDGQPVDFRPSTGNFFGDELIPISAVERVEIIRGPASALYGANAFLGVVNVITRTGSNIHSSASLQGNLVRQNPGFGGSVMMGAQADKVDVLIAGSYSQWDRSGLSLPSSSPVLHKLVWPPPTVPYSQRGDSQNDLARPKSFFGKIIYRPTENSHLSLMGSVQNLDSVAEFQDFGALFHNSRVSLVNQNYRLLYEVQASQKVALQFSAYYLNAAPGDKDQLDTGQRGVLMERFVGTNGFGLTAESRIQAHEKVALTVGADAIQEDHLLQTFDQRLTADVFTSDGTVLRSAGTVIPGTKHGARRTFRNLGAYAQGIYTISPEWSATAGARLDVHSIYGTNPSWRLALVYAPPDGPVNVKFLYGSAFKAPSAVQLYTQPLNIGDAQGNPNLRAQRADTFEVAGGYQLPNERGELSVNVFATNVRGRIEFLQKGFFSQAQNLLDEWVVGGELDARFRIARPLMLRCSAGIAETVFRSDGGLLTGVPKVSQPLFPPVQVHLIGDYLLPWAGLHLSAEASFVGQRTTSQSNALVNGSDYSYAPYIYTAAALSTSGRKIFGDLDTSAALRVSNVTNKIWTDPGFGGIDVPAQGRTVLLTISQSL